MTCYEENYYFNHAVPCSNDLDEAIEIATQKLQSSKSPVVACIFDNETGDCVFYAEK